MARRPRSGMKQGFNHGPTTSHETFHRLKRSRLARTTNHLPLACVLVRGVRRSVHLTSALESVPATIEPSARFVVHARAVPVGDRVPVAGVYYRYDQAQSSFRRSDFRP